MNELSELARVRKLARVGDDQLAGQASGAGARALLAAIVEEKPGTEAATAAATDGRRAPRSRRGRRLLVGLAATAALATAAVMGPVLLERNAGTATSYANTAIDIELRGDEYIARIKDPFADHALYAEAFQAMGLDIGVELIPASPTRVGAVVRYGFAGTTEADRLGGGLEPDGCALGHEGCFLTVTVSKGFKGRGTFYLGRPARPGEKYQAQAEAGRKGEMLEGYEAAGRTVGEVMTEAHRRGLRVAFQIIEPNPDGNGYSMNPAKQSAKVGDHWYVWAADPEQAGTVRLLVTEKKLPKNPVTGE
ncbi:hypothetical protein [Nonomuraea aurantiaca]|uniref:hypothetical protein n=1 Tax=Nonomuraea aurantiaca TaxID=2878562 RepID=UPI001CD9FCE2|nr:hypothetical protein [Nonomuraea aurantiaca]MCA2224593.1 hypothetical protein [Nonomuraea aurantiaca]